jgi:hypothetical protein
MKWFQRSPSLGRELRRERPRPTEELVTRISRDVSGRSRPARLNLALAFALTTALVLAFALTGGIGYAASAVSGGTSAITQLVSPKDGKSGNNAAQNQGSSANQYGHKVLICHIPPGHPENAHTISVDQSAVPAHLAHGDTLGPCS